MKSNLPRLWIPAALTRRRANLGLQITESDSIQCLLECETTRICSPFNELYTFRDQLWNGANGWGATPRPVIYESEKNWKPMPSWSAARAQIFRLRSTLIKSYKQSVVSSESIERTFFVVGNFLFSAHFRAKWRHLIRTRRFSMFKQETREITSKVCRKSGESARKRYFETWEREKFAKKIFFARILNGKIFRFWLWEALSRLNFAELGCLDC